jgi:hypothetical protein
MINRNIMTYLPSNQYNEMRQGYFSWLVWSKASCVSLVAGGIFAATSKKLLPRTSPGPNRRMKNNQSPSADRKAEG